jgi:hypothetical protein
MTSQLLVLDRTQLVWLVQTQDFYEHCPDFAAIQNIVPASPPATGCLRCAHGRWLQLYPRISAFVELLQQYRVRYPEAVERLRTFLELKKGRPCRPVVLYYRPYLEHPPVKFQF